MELPNYEEHADSPKLDKVGVAAKLAKPTYAAGEPVALYGAYLIDGPFIQKCHDDPWPWILVLALGRDQPLIWVKSARDYAAADVVRPEKVPPMSPSVRQGAYFNLDLRKHLGLPEQPGRYWILVAMSDHVTDKMSLELKK